MKTFFLTTVFVCFCLFGYTQTRPKVNVSAEKIGSKATDIEAIEGFIYGKLDYKSVRTKGKSQGLTREGIILILRDVETKKILDVTQTDKEGRFKFNKMKSSKRQVELRCGINSQKWPPLDEWGCPFIFEKLQPDHNTMQMIEACDDSTLIYRIQTGYCICVTDPCPCSDDPFQQLLKAQW